MYVHVYLCVAILEYHGLGFKFRFRGRIFAFGVWGLGFSFCGIFALSSNAERKRWRAGPGDVRGGGGAACVLRGDLDAISR